MPTIYADVPRHVIGRLSRYALANGGDIAPILTEAIETHLDSLGVPFWFSRGDYCAPALSEFVTTGEPTPKEN